MTRRDNIARVINEFTTWLHERMTHYASLGQYPVNMPFEVRLCKVDDADEVLVDAAGVPDLSPVRPRPDRPDWDTAIWMNVVSIPGTAGMPAFFREMEQWMAAHYSGDYATFRSEWSKGWAFDDEAATATPVSSVRRCRPCTAPAYRPGRVGTPRSRLSSSTTRTGCSATGSSTGCCPDVPLQHPVCEKARM